MSLKNSIKECFKKNEHLQSVKIETILQTFAPTPVSDSLILTENYNLAPRMTELDTDRWQEGLIDLISKKKENVKSVHHIYLLYKRYLQETVYSEYFLYYFNYSFNFEQDIICTNCYGHGSVPENYTKETLKKPFIDRYYLEKFAKLAGLESWEKYATEHATANMMGKAESGFAFCSVCGGVGQIMRLDMNNNYLKYLFSLKIK